MLVLLNPLSSQHRNTKMQACDHGPLRYNHIPATALMKLQFPNAMLVAVLRCYASCSFDKHTDLLLLLMQPLSIGFSNLNFRSSVESRQDLPCLWSLALPCLALRACISFIFLLLIILIYCFDMSVRAGTLGQRLLSSHLQGCLSESQTAKVQSTCCLSELFL